MVDTNDALREAVRQEITKRRGVQQQVTPTIPFQRVDRQIEQRKPNFSPFFKPIGEQAREFKQHPFMTPLKTLGAAYEGFEAPLASAGLAIQQRKPWSQVGQDYLKAASGQRPAEFGDIFQSSNIPVMRTQPVKSALGLALTPGGAEFEVDAAKAVKAFPQAIRNVPKAIGAFRQGISGRGLRKATPELEEKLLLQAPAAKRQEIFKVQRRRQAGIFGAKEEALASEQKVALAGEKAKTFTEVQGAKVAQAGRLQSLVNEQKTVARQVDEIARGKVLEARPKVGEWLHNRSVEYRQLYDEAAESASDIQVSERELRDYISQRYSDRPDMVRKILDKVLPIQGGLEELPFNLQEQALAQIPEKALSGKKLLKDARNLRGNISKSAKESRRLFNESEYFSDEASHTITDFLREQGVEGLDAPAKFWRETAPTATKAVKTLRPFLATPEETGTGISLLKRVASMKDPGNEEFVSRLQKHIGLDLTGDLKQVYSKLDSLQKAKVSSILESKLKQSQLRFGSQQSQAGIRAGFLGKKQTLESSQRMAESVLQHRQADIAGKVKPPFLTGRRLGGIALSALERFIIYGALWKAYNTVVGGRESP